MKEIIFILIIGIFAMNSNTLIMRYDKNIELSFKDNAIKTSKRKFVKYNSRPKSYYYECQFNCLDVSIDIGYLDSLSLNYWDTYAENAYTNNYYYKRYFYNQNNTVEYLAYSDSTYKKLEFASYYKEFNNDSSVYCVSFMVYNIDNSSSRKDISSELDLFRNMIIHSESKIR